SLMKWRSLTGASEHEKKVIYLEKQDTETFGFEIQTYGLHHRNENEMEMCTFVCRVRDNSSAELGGLKRGDTLTSINGVCVQGFRHRDIVELIKSSGNTLSLETVYGSSIRRAELETRLLYLKQTLQEKWEEYRSLMIQEQRLVHGIVSNDPNIYDTFESVRASVLGPVGVPGVGGGGGLGGGGRGEGGSSSSGGSYLGSVEDEEPIYQTCVFDSGDSGSDGSGSGNRVLPHRRPLTRSASAKVGHSGFSAPPGGGQPASGTLPRKSRRKSLRKRLLKFIPGLNRPVEEEESYL
uniref:Trafficking regulator and scaffold protein tamalin n=2 Tax=Callorhinchus milii TaxID=7868 RepID=A0A4W3IPZ2_CALMI